MAPGILSLFFCYGAIALAAPGEPRIVTKPAVPADEVLIYTHNLVTDYGADATGRVDCTPRLQQALDDAGKDDGGIVFAPAGTYKILGHFVVPPGVTLMGEWQSPDEHPAAAGTVLAAYERGTTPMISLRSTATVKKLSIWYPEQSFTAPAAYPWTIWVDGGSWHGIEDLTFYNSYRGINEGGGYDGEPRSATRGSTGNDHVRNIYGTFLDRGLYHANSSNTSVFGQLHMSSKYWIGCGLPGAPAAAADRQTLKDGMRNNLVGLTAYGEQHLHKQPIWWVHLDCTQYHQVFVEDAKVGVDFQVDWSDLIDVDLRNVKVGVYVRETDGSFGIGIMGGTIRVLPGDDTCGIKYPANSLGKHIALQGLTIGGRPKYGICFDGKADDTLNVMKCVFENWDGYAIRAENGTAMIEACTFKKDAAQIYLSPRVQGAAILGNTFCGPRRIENHSSAREFRIDDAPLGIPDLPASMTGYRYLPKRKPHCPENFYNVAAAPYSAVKGGVRDCTAAIQKALDDAAAAGGGTVFVPGGVWRVNGTLTIPGGVELRGINSHPHNHGMAGTNLFSYANQGNAGGTPFITMQAGSQVNGFFVFYPQMALDNSTPFPWTVRGNGADLYVRNISFINAWNGLDFGTRRCDRFKVSGCSGSTKNLHISVGGESAGWVVEDCMNNWSYDCLYPAPDDGHIVSINERAKHCKRDRDIPAAKLPYQVGDASNGILFSLMSYDPGDRVSLRMGGTGRGPRNIDVLLPKSDVCHGFLLERGENINMVLPRGSHDCNIVTASSAATLNEFMELTWFSGRAGAYTQVNGGSVNIFQGHGSLVMECNGGTTRAFGIAFAPPAASKPCKVLVGPAVRSVQLTGCNATARDGVAASNDAGGRVLLRNNLGEKKNVPLAATAR